MSGLRYFMINTLSQFTFSFYHSFLLFLQEVHQYVVHGVTFSLFHLFTGSCDETACFLDYEDPDGEGRVTMVTE